MANAIYPKYKQSLLNGDSDTALTGSGSTGLYVALLSNAYVYSPTHQFYTDLTGVVAAQEITGVTTVNGLVNGAVTNLSTVSGPVIHSLVLYRKNTGSSSTWKLVSFEDTNILNFPITPTGADILINWNPSGIFQL